LFQDSEAATYLKIGMPNLIHPVPPVPPPLPRGVWEGVSWVSMDTPVLKSQTLSLKKINSSWEKNWGKIIGRKRKKENSGNKKVN
jgi:hypothetical protein